MVDVSKTMTDKLNAARGKDSDGGEKITEREVRAMVQSMMSFEGASPEDIRSAMRNQKLDPATKAQFEKVLAENGPVDVKKLKAGVAPNPALDKKVADAEKYLAATKPGTPERAKAEEALEKAKHAQWDALARGYFKIQDALLAGGQSLSAEERKELQALSNATFSKLADSDPGQKWARAGHDAAKKAGDDRLAAHYGTFFGIVTKAGF